jgi:lipoprotein-releasing system permease protein
LKTAFYIARRYLISKKSVNVINLISGISVAGITIGTFALVVILSTFNGLEFTIKSLFSAFDPGIRITSSIKGKPFDLNSLNTQTIKQIQGVASVTPIIEEDAFLMYENHQYFVTVKGVPLDYDKVSGLDSTNITSGKFILESNDIPYAVVGQGVAYYLSVGLRFNDAIHIYTLKKEMNGQVTLNNVFNHGTIYASGIFSSQQDIDSKYILVPFDYAREFFEMGNQVSAVEVGLIKGSSENKIKNEILKLSGNNFDVKTQFEQHEVFYKVMQSEKWAIFFILAFILVIASFNILGSLSMLIIDKKADIAILQSMGANKQLIRRIFLFEGWMISLSGAILGIVLGTVVCWIQIKFGIIKLPGNGSFIFNSYPVEIHLSDLISIFLLVSGIGFFAAWYPIRFISGKYLTMQPK